MRERENDRDGMKHVYDFRMYEATGGRQPGRDNPGRMSGERNLFSLRSQNDVQPLVSRIVSVCPQRIQEPTACVTDVAILLNRELHFREALLITVVIFENLGINDVDSLHNIQLPVYVEAEYTLFSWLQGHRNLKQAHRGLGDFGPSADKAVHNPFHSLVGRDADRYLFGVGILL